jgi:CheY-like chemotaxis protein
LERIVAGTATTPPPLPAAKDRRPCLDILVVDDDIDNRELVAAYMKNERYRVVFASDGPTAIEIAKKRYFDLILMDIEMPGLNGYETAHMILSEGMCRNSKIMGFSANAFRENAEKARQSGFSGYLAKPVRKAELLAAIQKCIASDGFYEIARAQAA